MSAFAALTPKVLVLFLTSVAFQLVGGTLLTRTEGFRNIGPTLLVLAVYGVAFWALAELIRDGAPLSVLMPVLAAVVPLALILIGVFVLGEPASVKRIGLLLVACMFIALASTM